MPWVRISDDFGTHPKVIAAGPMALALHVRMICHCARHLTDGAISPSVLDSVAADFHGRKAVTKLVKRLLDVRLWERGRRGNGFKIHDYLDYNPSRRAVLAQRKAASERMAKARVSKCSPELREKFARSSPYPVPVPVPVPTTTTPLTPKDPPAEQQPLGTASGPDEPCADCLTAIRVLNDSTCQSYPGAGRQREALHDHHARYGLDVVLAVIRDRVQEWGQDREMFRFLRPETLFAPDKFENYRCSMNGPSKPEDKGAAAMKRILREEGIIP